MFKSKFQENPTVNKKDANFCEYTFGILYSVQGFIYSLNTMNYGINNTNGLKLSAMGLLTIVIFTGSIHFKITRPRVIPEFIIFKSKFHENPTVNKKDTNFCEYTFGILYSVQGFIYSLNTMNYGINNTNGLKLSVMGLPTIVIFTGSIYSRTPNIRINWDRTRSG